MIASPTCASLRVLASSKPAPSCREDRGEVCNPVALPVPGAAAGFSVVLGQRVCVSQRICSLYSCTCLCASAAHTMTCGWERVTAGDLVLTALHHVPMSNGESSSCCCSSAQCVHVPKVRTEGSYLHTLCHRHHPTKAPVFHADPYSSTSPVRLLCSRRGQRMNPGCWVPAPAQQYRPAAPHFLTSEGRWPGIRHAANRQRKKQRPSIISASIAVAPRWASMTQARCTQRNAACSVSLMAGDGTCKVVGGGWTHQRCMESRQLRLIFQTQCGTDISHHHALPTRT